MRKPSTFWVNWLLVVSLGVAVFGVLLVVAPSLARWGFSLMVFGDGRRMDQFDETALHYISLAHAVLGAVMVGWGLSLAFVVRGLLAEGSDLGWRIIAISVAVWFALDTGYSLWSGFWQNSILNLALLALFAVPLVATYKPQSAANV